ncbi:hypothetical protein OG616_21460 [Streptomyces antibioticus]|uniref:hypothetical protein n=1 Tax=Streptomyces antibioticus TaxID=1890 RepID=UPI0022536F66|nr:hypothetical protein [Streptomyces antibioticus]MCX5170563.1 hypothetical protein [Streptomyces antibioticus]
MERKTRTRRPTPAERLAARALGQAEPEEVAVDVTPTAALIAERLTAPRKSAKPAGMQTAEWFALRARGEAGPPAA